MPGRPGRADGAVFLREPQPEDTPVLIAARDAEFRRWLGPGSDSPAPAFCILAGGQLAGWVDYDTDPEHDWLADGEVNVGYFVFPEHRGRGCAATAVELLLAYLAAQTGFTTATLLIDPANAASLAVARRCGFACRADVRGQRFFARPIAR